MVFAGQADISSLGGKRDKAMEKKKEDEGLGIPYEIKCKLVQTVSVDKLLKNPMTDKDYEGIDIFEGIDLHGRKDGGFQVSWNPMHDRGVKASPTAKPTKLDLSVPSLKIQRGKIQVFSLLQRTPLGGQKGDGNPLVYLLKGHPAYEFKTGKDKQLIYDCINGILKNFISEFFSSINSKVGVVLCPSGNALNMSFAKKLNSLAKKSGYDLEVFGNVLAKMSVDAMEDLLFDGYEPSFNWWLSTLPQDVAAKKIAELEDDLARMREKHGGTFAFHFVHDRETRRHITKSMVADYGGREMVDGKDILLIDDTMTTGQTLREACETLCECYTPKSITALTLFSPLKKIPA